MAKAGTVPALLPPPAASPRGTAATIASWACAHTCSTSRRSQANKRIISLLFAEQLACRPTGISSADQRAEVAHATASRSPAAARRRNSACARSGWPAPPPPDAGRAARAARERPVPAGGAGHLDRVGRLQVGEEKGLARLTDSALIGHARTICEHPSIRRSPWTGGARRRRRSMTWRFRCASGSWCPSAASRTCCGTPALARRRGRPRELRRSQRRHAARGCHRLVLPHRRGGPGLRGGLPAADPG